MSRRDRLLTMLLGLALILHGLGNAVLPMRGADAAGASPAFPGVTLLYVAAIVGFVAAGLAVWGMRPLVGLETPLALVAGVGALGAQFRQGDLDLWPGVVLSAVLPLLTALSTTIRIDGREAAGAGATARKGRAVWRRVGDVVGWAFLIWITVAAAAWPWHRAWGTEPVDWSLSFPADRIPRQPAMEILHAVTIDAPPEAVWPWLMQLGQDRAGFYSYDRLERLFQVDIHNASEIRPEWQLRRVGDLVPATQPHYLGGLFGERPGWTVDVVDPNRALVLRGWGAFVLRSTADGRTRLLVRSTISNERIPTWAAALNLTAFELPHFIMQRRMLIGIKTRAEARWRVLANVHAEGAA